MKSFLILLSLVLLSLPAFAQDVAKTNPPAVKKEPPAEVPLNPFIALKLENAEQKAQIEQLKRDLYQARVQNEWRTLVDAGKAVKEEYDAFFTQEATRAGVPLELLKEYKREKDEKTGTIILRRQTPGTASN